METGELFWTWCSSVRSDGHFPLDSTGKRFAEQPLQMILWACKERYMNRAN